MCRTRSGNALTWRQVLTSCGSKCCAIRRCVTGESGIRERVCVVAFAPPMAALYKDVVAGRRHSCYGHERLLRRSGLAVADDADRLPRSRPSVFVCSRGDCTTNGARNLCNVGQCAVFLSRFIIEAFSHTCGPK